MLGKFNKDASHFLYTIHGMYFVANNNKIPFSLLDVFVTKIRKRSKMFNYLKNIENNFDNFYEKISNTKEFAKIGCTTIKLIDNQLMFNFYDSGERYIFIYDGRSKIHNNHSYYDEIMEVIKKWRELEGKDKNKNQVQD